jgi:hypothetical protein
VGELGQLIDVGAALGSTGTLDILPSSVPRESKNVKTLQGMNWIPIFCANCGCDGGYVPEANKDFAFYLCQPCADRYGNIAGTMMVPDEVFWARVKAEQLERHGRELTPQEVIEAIKDSDNPLAKLARDRRSFPEYQRR